MLNKLTSDAKDEFGKPLGFPQLRTCGGFEMLQCLANCRDLSVIGTSWSVRDHAVSLDLHLLATYSILLRMIFEKCLRLFDLFSSSYNAHENIISYSSGKASSP